MSVVCALLVVLGEDECREELNRTGKCAANVFRTCTPWYTPILFYFAMLSISMTRDVVTDPSACCAPSTVLI